MKLHKLLVRGVGTAIVLGLTLCSAAPALAATPKTDPNPWPIRIAGPLEPNSFPKALALSVLTPAANPAGANNFNCKPSATHPEPVILIHGTLENALNNWSGLTPILADQGYCVFAVNYGNTTGLPWINATADRVAASSEIAAFVAKVRKATKAEHVALIGHSQGGGQARYYANLLAPEGEVTKVIGIAPTNHATTKTGLTALIDAIGLGKLVANALALLGLPGVAQQSDAKAPFFINLNNDGETRAGITYTNIVTNADQINTPYTVGNLKQGKGATVSNITIQTTCSADKSEHMSLPYSKNVAQLVLNALDPEHPHKVKCYAQTALTGTTGPS